MDDDIASLEQQLAGLKSLSFKPGDGNLIAWTEEELRRMKSNRDTLIDYEIRLRMEARGK